MPAKAESGNSTTVITVNQSSFIAGADYVGMHCNKSTEWLLIEANYVAGDIC